MNNQLGKILTEQGRSKTWLSNQLGVTVQTVLNWCNNVTQPGAHRAMKIAELLNLKGVDDLYKS